MVKFQSLQPFVPSGPDFESSKQLFQELGFSISWDAGDYVGFEKDGHRFILQKHNNREFAENFMLSVGVSNLNEFREFVLQKKLVEKFGISVGEIIQQTYGRELNIIDIAGVCWHFVE